MTILGKLALTVAIFLVPLIAISFGLYISMWDEKQPEAFYKVLRATTFLFGMEVGFAILAIWGVR